MSGWNADNTASSDPGEVTILEGSSFCVSGPMGDVVPGSAHGWFLHDTRMLSRWTLLAGGDQVSRLDAYTPEPHRAVFVGRVAHMLGREGTLIVERDRTVNEVLREVVTVRNYGTDEDTCTLALSVGSDFADLFDVKAGREGILPAATYADVGDRLLLQREGGGSPARVLVTCPGATVRGDALVITLAVPPKGSASATFTAAPTSAQGESDLTPHTDHTRQRSEQTGHWLRSLPSVTCENEDVENLLVTSARDLDSLRMMGLAEPGRVVIAAGVPWFMTLFGRDSLLAGYMALPADRTLALGVLRTLAEHQGSRVVDATDEEPGRILHEIRRGRAAAATLGGSGVYYGTDDATPLFVNVMGELHRWGVLAGDDLERMLPHADRALAWTIHYGDRDGDGFVEYARRSDHGLLHQGWKDSTDAITFADGTPARGPIALAEVQGYVYRAWRDRAEMARAVGDDARAAECDERADALQAAFTKAFWLPHAGWFALALDGDKRPVDALASNMGHCLWSGIVDTAHAPAVAERLLSPELFSGWGIRTLAVGMGAYNPVSYHNGSVWPHDNALIVDGLMRYGFVEHAQRVASAMLDAATHFRGRLPELFCGFDRREHPQPIAYPTSCAPQAWAAASGFHLLRVLLRFAPDIPHRTYRLSPALPERMGAVRVEGLRLGGGVFTFSARENDVVFERTPPSLRRRPS